MDLIWFPFNLVNLELQKKVLEYLAYFNPLSAMVAIWRHIIVSFQVFGTERVHCNLDCLGDMHPWEVHWGKECLSIGGCQLNGLRGRAANGLRGTSSPFCRHPSILASSVIILDCVFAYLAQFYMGKTHNSGASASLKRNKIQGGRSKIKWMRQLSNNWSNIC
jgi:hypothetical protein